VGISWVLAGSFFLEKCLFSTTSWVRFDKNTFGGVFEALKTRE
jgi:hypothetical protein